MLTPSRSSLMAQRDQKMKGQSKLDHGAEIVASFGDQGVASAFQSACLLCSQHWLWASVALRLFSSQRTGLALSWASGLLTAGASLVDHDRS